MSILIIDYSPSDRKQLELLLNLGGYFELIFAENSAEAFVMLGIDIASEVKADIDLIMMDITMPGIDGIQICRRIKATAHLKDIPLIVVTENNSIETMLSCFEAGAADYIVKPLHHNIGLVARANSALNLKREMDIRKAREKELMELTKLLEDSNKKLQQANKMLEAMATIDGLTGIANRRFFDRFFEREWKRALRDHKPLTIAMLDIDYFKLYNDHYGHQQGDECLKQFAMALKESVQRPGDLVARYGGEEFIALLNETEQSGAEKVAELVKQKVADLKIEHATSKVTDRVTFSMGIATLVPAMDQSPKDLIEMADKALYQAKETGRNRHMVYQP